MTKLSIVWGRREGAKATFPPRLFKKSAALSHRTRKGFSERESRRRVVTDYSDVLGTSRNPGACRTTLR